MPFNGLCCGYIGTTLLNFNPVNSKDQSEGTGMNAKIENPRKWLGDVHGDMQGGRGSEGLLGLADHRRPRMRFAFS